LTGRGSRELAVTRNWDSTVGQLEPLSVALYLRDALRLEIAQAAWIPPATPPPTRARVETGTDLGRASDEWLDWWNELLQEAATGRGLGKLVSWDAERASRLVTASPSLYALAGGVLPDAQRWASLRSREFARYRRGDAIAPASGRTGAETERHVLGRVSRRRGRRSAPLSIRIVVLPVEGAHGWQLRPNLLLVTPSLMFDEHAYATWLEGRLVGV
jgi:hypothetical protein